MESAGFNDLILAFAANHPNLTTNVEQKPVDGQGGILSYLRTGHSVAPQILPDLIVLPNYQLKTAANEGLIFPINDLVDSALYEDMFPAALAAARPDDQLLGLPFALTQLPHLAYQNSVVTSTLTLVWGQLVEENPSQFIFPAAGDQGATLALELYLAEGGQLTNEAGQPALELGPLTAALQLLEAGRRRDFVAPQSSNISQLDEAWQLFESGSTGFALTTADYYLRQRSEALPTGFAPLPGPAGALTPLVKGWAWAVSSAEPEHRALAGELLSILYDAQFLGTWSYQSLFLPASRRAFSQWPATDPYSDFVQQELERARPFPYGPSHNVMTALGNAVFDVISLAQTPQAAAAAAVDSLQP